MAYNTVKTTPHIFNSLNEFYKYIIETPLNNTFRWKKLSSSNNNYKFTGTYSFEEAIDLFKNGWNVMAKKLTDKLNFQTKQMQHSTKQKSNYDMAGYQVSVPRYLQGIPTSMINKKNVPMKQKVITLNKDISYACMVTTDEILEYSTNTLEIIKRAEDLGYRINLNLIFGSGEAFVKIKLKSANERLNISKLAFPLVNPSMLRRLLFRYIEVEPSITPSMIGTYGVPYKSQDLQQKGEILLPKEVTQETIKEILEKIQK